MLTFESQVNFSSQTQLNQMGLASPWLILYSEPCERSLNETSIKRKRVIYQNKIYLLAKSDRHCRRTLEEISYWSYSALALVGFANLCWQTSRSVTFLSPPLPFSSFLYSQHTVRFSGKLSCLFIEPNLTKQKHATHMCPKHVNAFSSSPFEAR